MALYTLYLSEAKVYISFLLMETPLHAVYMCSYVSLLYVVDDNLKYLTKKICGQETAFSLLG